MIVIFAFLHHLAAFALVAALAVEFVLIRQPMTLENARRMLVIDGIYGASAVLLLVVGMLRVFFFEKGAAYYFSNHAFLSKLGLFIIVAALSVVPTLEILRWRKAVQAGTAPVVEEHKLKRMRKLIHWELAAIVFILLFAAMMARGGFI
jgi:putative membrane protein